MKIEQLVEELKASGEYEDLMLSIGRLETYREIEEKIMKLCFYAFGIGEAVGEETGYWRCRDGRLSPD